MALARPEHSERSTYGLRLTRTAQLIPERTSRSAWHAPQGSSPRQENLSPVDDADRELWERMGGLLSPPRRETSGAGSGTRKAHHSTAIEGNTLVPKEVEQLLAQGRAAGNRLLMEYTEVRGYADAAERVYGQAIRAVAGAPMSSVSKRYEASISRPCSRSATGATSRRNRTRLPAASVGSISSMRNLTTPGSAPAREPSVPPAGPPPRSGRSSCRSRQGESRRRRPRS